MYLPTSPKMFIVRGIRIAKSYIVPISWEGSETLSVKPTVEFALGNKPFN